MENISLGYELGVMMFHACNNWGKIEQATGGYDVSGNFEALCVATNDQVKRNDLQKGFLAESQNMGMPENTARQFFAESYQEIFEQ